jgi:hypothetical protein
VGKTLAADEAWTATPTTSPEQDFRTACGIYAGVLAEHLFDKDFRFASSLDEVLATELLAHQIAEKTGREPVDVIYEVRSVTAEILKTNADVVRAFARDLERHGAVRKRRLEELLERVCQRAKG